MSQGCDANESARNREDNPDILGNDLGVACQKTDHASDLAGAGLEPAPRVRAAYLPELVRAFKTFSAQGINACRNARGRAVWQRGYYEHIIRNDDALDKIRHYIMDNAAQWALDRENPAAADGGSSSCGRRQQDVPWRV